MSDRYTAELSYERNIPIVRLTDQTAGVEVLILPSHGNRACSMKVRGEEILHFPFEHPADAIGTRDLNGIPFLAPWANRLDTAGFGANGRWYTCGEPESLRRDGNGLPIHGLLIASSLWQVSECAAGAESAQVVSRLEFWRCPDLMANWPIAHEYEMTYRLRKGVLEVRTSIRNLSRAPMPVAVGYHPYFTLPGVKREDAFASVPARFHVETDAQLVATGQTAPSGLAERVSLREHQFDDGFTGLVCDSAGLAVFSVEGAVEGRARSIEVVYGPKYPVAVVYAPPGKEFICFEPMTTVTNGVNLAFRGHDPGLQSIAPGGTWEESFWVRAFV